MPERSFFEYAALHGELADDDLRAISTAKTPRFPATYSHTPPVGDGRRRHCDRGFLGAAWPDS